MVLGTVLCIRSVFTDDRVDSSDCRDDAWRLANEGMAGGVIAPLDESVQPAPEVNTCDAAVARKTLARVLVQVYRWYSDFECRVSGEDQETAPTSSNDAGSESGEVVSMDNASADHGESGSGIDSELSDDTDRRAIGSSQPTVAEPSQVDTVEQAIARIRQQVGSDASALCSTAEGLFTVCLGLTSSGGLTQWVENVETPIDPDAVVASLLLQHERSGPVPEGVDMLERVLMVLKACKQWTAADHPAQHSVIALIHSTLCCLSTE